MTWILGAVERKSGKNSLIQLQVSRLVCSKADFTNQHYWKCNPRFCHWPRQTNHCQRAQCCSSPFFGDLVPKVSSKGSVSATNTCVNWYRVFVVLIWSRAILRHVTQDVTSCHVSVSILKKVQFAFVDCVRNPNGNVTDVKKPFYWHFIINN